MKDNQVYLLHIKDSIQQILDYSKDGREAFFSDRKSQDAVIRNLEIVGEATKNVSEELKSRHPDIPWKQMAGMRDKMIHDYFGVDLELVWDVIQDELPRLKEKVEKILTEQS